MTPVEVETQLSKLKDFQRRTVDYVFKRFYRDNPPARRFLVADEVGLGKTLVARGLIAKCIHELEEKGIPRIDIVYVCSNAAIAQQNISRLNVLGKRSIAYATRLTLLPQEVGDLEKNRVNFVSFTPGTTFDLKSRGGIREERGLLYRLLVGKVPGSPTALRNLLQAGAGAQRWKEHLQVIVRERPDLSPQLSETFLTRVNGDATTHEFLADALERFRIRRDDPPKADTDLQYNVIGRLRHLLAETCVDALEPDLIILDEFQRFKDLLHGDSDAAELARSLYNYKDARVLLLSATPYRMLTLAHETDENHYRDFLDTVEFLQDGSSQDIRELERALSDYRSALLSPGADADGRREVVRHGIESQLRAVMTRTERVSSTVQRDSMLGELQLSEPPTSQEVDEAVILERLSKSLGVPDSIEYWKSAPAVLSFMDNYVLKETLLNKKRIPDNAQSALELATQYSLKQRAIRRYEPLAVHNARLRVLSRETLDTGNWRLLWLPPALPYIAPMGPYADLTHGAYTKSLLFSSWTMVPKAVAALLSYEAERKMLGDTTGFSYESLNRTQRPLLRFHVEKERGPGGMPTLALMYPCATLVAHVDPLALSLDLGDGRPANLQDVREHIARRIHPLVVELVARHGGDSVRADERWYWAAPALLDQRHHGNVIDWLEAEDGFRACFRESPTDDSGDDSSQTQESHSALDRHIEELLNVVHGKIKLGRPPDDLEQVIADYALASPAIAAARALMRVSRLASAWDSALLKAATLVAKGFRTLFNTPEAICMLRDSGGDDGAYWRRVLDYCVEGNLQSTLDEYAHLLVESTGMLDGVPDEVVTAISQTMAEALSPRSAMVGAEELRVNGDMLSVNRINFRCRYALRFGDIRDEQDSTIARADTVRHAFNSPFRPFVLASTSVGQEGLDFHSYCHVVYHWNLPSNPVDLEQREGRVHRYKGHAVRRNVALRFGLTALRQSWGGDGDPWQRLFELAAAERPKGASELIPYWIFETEGGVQVERRIPLMPLSRETAQLERLKRELALYRLAFGQPRQQDLLAYLVGRSDMTREEADRWRIRLEP